MRKILLLALALAFALVAPPVAAEAPAGFYVVDVYDANRNPKTDLTTAIAAAQAAHKRILMLRGGDWCVWCQILEQFLDNNSDVMAAFAQTFVVLKVNVSVENENAAFLSAYPEADGYPDFLILESDGAYLGQQPTQVLEEGRSYNRQRMLDFVARWRMTDLSQ